MHVSESQNRKLDHKVKKCILVGYDSRRKGWKCMDTLTQKFVVSRDVIFDEVSSYYGESSQIEHESGNSFHKKSTYLSL